MAWAPLVEAQIPVAWRRGQAETPPVARSHRSGIPGTRLRGCSLASVSCTVHARCFACIDFEEPGAVIAPRQQFSVPYGDSLSRDTHEGRPTISPPRP